MDAVQFTLPNNMHLRAVTGDDRALLEAWLAADPEHIGTSPEFFLQQQPGIECYVLTDQEGAIFFLKLTRSIRIDIQFTDGVLGESERAAHERNRTRNGLVSGFAWLRRRLAAAGIHEVVTSSKNPRLIQTLCRRLGFAQSPDELVRSVHFAPTEEE